MLTPTAKKFFGAVVAALTLTLVTNVAPASAATKSSGKTTTTSSYSSGTTRVRDTGWDIP